MRAFHNRRQKLHSIISSLVINKKRWNRSETQQTVFFEQLRLYIKICDFEDLKKSFPNKLFFFCPLNIP